MTRATRVIGYTSVIALFYFLAFFSILPVPFVSDETKDEVLAALPWWLLVSFGSYSLWSLGWGLFTFRNCPEAYTELMGEISEAKNELRSKGVTVD